VFLAIMVEPGAVAAELAGALRDRLTAIVELTGELVTIDSGSGDPDGVGAVTAIVAERLSLAGFAADATMVDGAGPLLVARRPAGSRRVLVVGHADTVWPAGTSAAWPFREHAGRLHGPGVGDMKASLAAACETLALLAEGGHLDGVDVTVLVVPDEELGSRGSREAIEAQAREADICLGLEAADAEGAVVVARGAVGALVVRATGRSAHATDEPPGASALSPLASMVAPLEALTDRAEGVLVTAGILRAGTARQVVPETAELHLDLRAPDAASAERLEQRVRDVIGAGATREISLELTGGFLRPAWQRSAAGDTLFELARTAGEAIGESIGARVERGGSDASFPAAMGVATLDGLGPVCHDSCSRWETVEVASIPIRGAVLGALIACPPHPVDRKERAD
jgi:glutamate carboxypeptidase